MRWLAPAVVLILALSSPAQSRTWHVLPDGTGDAPTIQAAIDSSAAGDSVLVAAGTYVENVVTQPARLLIGSWDPAFSVSDIDVHPTTIDADSLGTCLYAEFAEEDLVGLIAGLHLTNGIGVEMRSLPARRRGGAVHVAGLGNFRDCIIDESVAYHGGGAYIAARDVSLVRVTFANNDLFDPHWRPGLRSPGSYYEHSGGGAYIVAESTLVVDSCEVTGNRSDWVPGGYGIGLYCESPVATFLSSEISRNVSPNGSSGSFAVGGGVEILCDSLVVRDCVFEGNRISGDGPNGGGIAADARIALFEDCDFLENQVSWGGGISLGYQSTATIVGCRFIDNTANGGDGAGGGGGVAGGTLVIEDCWIVGNFGSGGGGGSGGGVNGQAVTVRNSDVSDNVSSRGGGGISALTLLAENTTVTGNSLVSGYGSRGAGIYVRQGGSGTVVNSIIAHNQTDFYPRPDDSGGIWGAVDSRYNLFHNNETVDTYGLVSEVGHVYADPLFAGGEGPDGYRLRLHSPAIDRGDPAILDPDGSRSDMGVYGGPAAVMDQPTRVSGLSATRTAGGLALEWEANPAPDLAGYAIYRLPTSDTHPGLENFLTRTTGTTLLDPVGPPWPHWYYRVSAYDLDTYGGGYSDAETPTRVGDLTVSTALAPELRSVAPNPTSGAVSMEITTSTPMVALIEIFDLQGRRVWSGAQEAGAGTSRLEWPGRDSQGRMAAPGHYFLRVRLGDQQFQRKVVIVR